MAEKTAKYEGSSKHWTNERHINFLNSMEASFVQSMFPPLDRYLPDISESTKDLVNNNVDSSGTTREKKTRNLSSQKSTQDQVVPQFPNKGE
ncbi:hypothetical protein CASFOL_008323 [Castilleja foliolosa]|uniref:Uncharacterized protein n=1 Tax=Castilleja foliolosa TaxID=1961234 RepID=A0ABD3DYN3_9LAMI